MRAPLVALVLAALAPLAAAQANGGPTLTVEPDLVSLEPGRVAPFALAIHNPTKDTLGVEVGAVNDPESPLRATLTETTLRIPPGQTVRVPGRLAALPDAHEGAHHVVFKARALAPTATTDAAGWTGEAVLQVNLVRPVVGDPALPVTLAPTPQADPAVTEAEAPLPAPDAAAVAIAGASATVGAGAAAWLWARRRFGPLMLLPLYTRLRKSRILEQPTRQRIAATVEAAPGITFGELQRRTGLGAGTLTHHARKLEEAGVLFSSPDGQQRRFFHVGQGRVAPVPPLQERALARLHEGPATLATLSETLGASKQSLHYHLKRLVKEGLVDARLDGREVVLSVRAPAAAEGPAAARAS